jgi:hypothetical protein
MTEIVNPTINDFEANPTSRRHAFLACIATFHCVDYLSFRTKSGKPPKNKGNLLNDLRCKSNPFAVIDRVAHAFKHVSGGDENSKYIPVLKEYDVVTRPAAKAGIMSAGRSGAGDAVGGVMIWNEADGCYDLLWIVKQAAKFLRDEMHLDNPL